MKKLIRRTALFLAVLIALTALVTACKPKDDDDGNQGGWSLGDSGKAATPDNIPEDTDFGGYQFKVLHRAGDWVNFFECEGSIEGEAVNPVYRSVYERNMRVEMRLNCKMKYIATQSTAPGEGSKEVQNHLDAEDYYDYFMLTNNLIVTHRRNYQLCDFNDAEYVEYHQPWWWEEVMKEMAYDGKTINYLVGDMNLVNFTKMSAFYFNFDLIKTILQKEPQFFYDLVDDGKWTIEKVDQLTALCYRDYNGNGQEDEGDLFGFPWTGGEVAHQFIMSTRIADQFYTRNPDDSVTLHMHNNEDIYQVVEAVRHLLRDNKGVRDYHTMPAGTFDHLIIEEFASGKYVFLAQRLTAACSDYLREMKSLYGIVPYPTLEEGDEYISDIQASSTNICCPLIAEKNLEMIGICIEAHCSESYRYTTDEFFNMALKNKYTNDIESARMVDIIYETAHKSFLIEYSSAAQGITGCMNSAVEANSNTITSLLESKKGAEQSINMYIAETKATMLGYS